MNLVQFWTICSTNGVVLDEDMRNNFKRYAEELAYWNQKINMISRKDQENIWDRHLLHSLSILKYVDLKHKSYVMDIGTGGGLPGLPVKIARPDIRLTMIDSIAKKTKTSEMFAKHTGLTNIQMITGRAEEFSEKNQLKFDYIIARAVAPCVKLVDWSNKALKKNGQYLFLKGGDLANEISDLKKKYPKAIYEIIDINILGVDWFKNNEKKLVKIKL